MSRLPRITVITPCLDQAHILESTICSVLDQGYSDLEYIVIDGGSTDHTAQIVQRYRTGITRFDSQICSGPAEALNHAIASATGRWVGFLPAGDLYLPGAFEALTRHHDLSQPADPAWIVGHAVRIDLSDSYLGPTPVQAPHSLMSFLMHESGALPLSSTFVRRDLLERAGQWDTELLFAPDYEFWARLLALSASPAIVAHTLATQRQSVRPRASMDPVRCGMEYIAAARRHAYALPVTQRYQLWRDCDRRERVYEMAGARTRPGQGQFALFNQIVSHPWSLVDNHLRHSLAQITHATPATPATMRRAA